MISILFGLLLLLGQTIGITNDEIVIRKGEAQPPPFGSPVNDFAMAEGEIPESETFAEANNTGINSLINKPTTATDEIKSIYTDRTFFLTAIKQNPAANAINGVTGITVPHHLLVKNLTAEIFAMIADNNYQTIIILGPDHFNGGKTPFSTTSKDFKTVFGTLGTDKKTVQTILSNPLIKESNLFTREHAVHAVAPFIKYHFPTAKIVPIAIKINANKEELDTLETTLKEVIKEYSIKNPNTTLIVQSTDFSHYLTEKEANQQDQQTIQALHSNDPDQILVLNQPDNIDSIGSQYIQSKLQKEYFNSNLQIIHIENSQQYTKDPVRETTSYITQIYAKQI